MTKLPVVVVAEQLRRPVPGGIGRYAEGVLGGLRQLTESDREAVPPVVVHASRYHGPGTDPLARLGFPVRTSPLPSPLLVAAWDRGIAPAPPMGALVHAVSLAAPPPRHGIPSVVTVHDLAWRIYPEATTRRGRRWHEAALRRALSRSAALVAPSRSVGRQLETAGAPRVAVIEHGLDHLPAPDESGARQHLTDLGVHGPYLLSVSTLEPRKNLGRLVAAYAAAHSQLPEPWPLVVVGPSGWGDRGLGSVPGVVPVGAVTDAVLAGLYAGARALAYVPLIEGYGLPPLEAMRAGIPVLTSDNVPSTEPGSDGVESALRVEATDVDTVAGGLVRIATDDALRDALVQAGHDRVAPLTWRHSAEHHVALWMSLLGTTT